MSNSAIMTAEICVSQIPDEHLNVQLIWYQDPKSFGEDAKMTFNEWCSKTATTPIKGEEWHEVLTKDEFEKKVHETRKTSSEWFRLTKKGIRVANGWTSHMENAYKYWNEVPITLTEYTSRLGRCSPWPPSWGLAPEPFQYK